MIYYCLKIFFSDYTIRLMHWDLLCRFARIKLTFKSNIKPASTNLHIGCGSRRIKGWVNSDIRNSDFDVDYTQRVLPWRDDSFNAIVSQHLIEHLELVKELLPFLKELRRILKQNGEIWLSCPDIEKICKSYLDNKMQTLLEDRKKRFPNYSMGEIPTQYMINDFFHQYGASENLYGFSPLDWTQGAHKNLYDYDILEWALQRVGFSGIIRVSEQELLNRFPEFLPRGDELQSIYIRATSN